MSPSVVAIRELDRPMVFGRYLLLRRISRGGMGEIFLAKSGQIVGFEKLCVIKKVLPNLAEDQDFIKRFIDEAKVAIKLSHANIAPVFEVGRTEGEYFLALEYIEGRDLRRLLTRLAERKQRMPLELALFAMREVASGLAYAHRKADEDGKPLNLVHCDISPPNVIVSFEGETKIIDFGIAKSAIRVAETNPKMGFGKYGYMAPEQLVRGGVVDRRTDIYASGVLLFELITGQRLFQFPEGADYREMARIVAQGKHPRPSDIDSSLRELDPVVLRAVAPDQAKRFATAEELRDAIQGALAARSPTLTADRLGTWLRDLFADEVAEDRERLRLAKTVDLSDYAEEIATRTDTVTFAFNEDATGKRNLGVDVQVFASRPPPLVPPPISGPVRLHGGDELDYDPGTMPVPRTPARGWMMYVIVALASFTLVLIVALLVKRLRGSDDEAAAPPPAPPAVSSAASQPVVQPFVVQPIEVPKQPPAASVASSVPAAVPVPVPVPVPVKEVRPGTPSHPPGSSARAQRERDKKDKPDKQPPNMTAKYKEVAHEYVEFKKAYGPRLDGEWNDILELWTYGGEDKQQKLDVMLNAFRRRMEKERGQ